MLFKKADDKLKRLQLLDELQASPVVDARQRAWLKEEYWRVKQGMEGERDAARLSARRDADAAGADCFYTASQDAKRRAENRCR